VRVRCNEGVAIHIDPEPCAGTREDTGERLHPTRVWRRTICAPVTGYAASFRASARLCSARTEHELRFF
jgi:hypothetical protein